LSNYYELQVGIMFKRSGSLYLGLVFTTTLLVGCGKGMDHMYSEIDPNRSFSSNGERIYFTGKNGAGEIIPFTGGGMRSQMHSNTCASCHGNDRTGGRRMYPTFWVTTPALTAEALFGDHDDGHGDHDSYTKASLKTAIEQGLEPSGHKLNSAMPRWVMSDSDLDDLVDYLSSL
jgi:cytochrome c553